MTIITFEFNPTLAEAKTKIQLNQGFHKGRIVNTDIITNVRPHDETQFCVTWQIGDNIFMDKFKLWANEAKKRTYAQEKLSNLCKAVDIALFSKKDGKNINFDTSVLVEKQCNLLISEFETIRGDKVMFIKQYEPVAPEDRFFNQEMPFNYE
jgi:hypothetical protein